MSESIHDFFDGKTVHRRALADWLDAAPFDVRRDAVRSLSRTEQSALFDAVVGFRPLTLADFVAPATPALEPVIHFGRNSLPAFRIFEKRFCRPAAAAGELWGYNEQSFKAFTGPGYFVARDAADGEVVIDYTRIPPAKPPEWPPILPNSARLSRFIYDGTRDFMRGVSRHVSVGRATRGGKTMDNWFVLCRDDRAG